MTPPPRPRCRIGLLMFEDMELLDHAGPYEVFTTAERMAQRATAEGAPPTCGFEVLNLAVTAEPVRARAGVRLLPDTMLADAPPLNLLLVPGGDVRRALDDEALIAGLADQAARAPMRAAVCTGVFLLARAGALPPGTPVTTHWEDLDDLRRDAPGLDVRAGVRWVQAPGTPPLWTSAGISAGIDLALHLVEGLAGRALAERTARQMDYRWADTP